MTETAYCLLHGTLEGFQYIGPSKRFDSHVERPVLLDCGRRQTIVQPAGSVR